MFKYISEILAQFSKAQKITVLCILLFVILIISLGPSFISAITLDRKELNTKIGQQDSTIRNLNTQVSELDLKIRRNESQCTNEMVKREMEFISMLDTLRKEMKMYNRLTRPVIKTSIAQNDSLIMMSPKIIEPVTTYKGLNPIINKINEMEKRLSKQK
jgi:hypothetical protein